MNRFKNFSVSFWIGWRIFKTLSSTFLLFYSRLEWKMPVSLLWVSCRSCDEQYSAVEGEGSPLKDWLHRSLFCRQADPRHGCPSGLCHKSGSRPQWLVPLVRKYVPSFLSLCLSVWSVCLISLFLSVSLPLSLSLSLFLWYVHQTCLPVCIWPIQYGNWTAVQMYTRISQNTDTEFSESMEIVTWANGHSLPAKLIVQHWWEVVVRWHLHISSLFRGWSIQPALISQNSLLNQWTSTLHQNFTEVNHILIWWVWNCQW